MLPKTAKQLLEEEVEEYRQELLAELPKRSDFVGEDLADYEIAELIQEARDDLVKEVAEYRDALLQELPERQVELDEEREYTFARVAFTEVWLPQCLTPVDGEPSTLVTRGVYEHYLAWCEAVGIDEPYSLDRVRNALKTHYGIANIRTGLKAYTLAQSVPKPDKNEIISSHEAAERKAQRDREQVREQERKREYQKLVDLVCPFCERRKYDGNRFDRCYWCNRIKTDGLDAALSDYLRGDLYGQRTGDSMRLAYQRMVRNGEDIP